MAVDRNVIQAFAEANGINIPEERLDLVLRQYQSFLRTLQTIDSVAPARETDPAITFTTTLPSFSAGSTGGSK